MVEKEIRMKRPIVLILLAALASSVSAGAQTHSTNRGYAIPDNEISVYYGQGSYTQLAMAVGGALGTAFTFGAARLEDLSSTGAIGVEYHRYVHRSIAVGGVLGYEGGTMKFAPMSGTDENGDPVHDSGASSGSDNFTFIHFMPSVAFKWFSLPNVSMYSRVALGAMLGISGGTSNIAFAFQASPVAIDFGGTMIRGFLEAGFGCQGILTAGLRACF